MQTSRPHQKRFVPFIQQLHFIKVADLSRDTFHLMVDAIDSSQKRLQYEKFLWLIRLASFYVSMMAMNNAKQGISVLWQVGF